MTPLRTLLHVVGARPQFIKLAPLLRALAAFPFRSVVLHTGQHYDDRMSQLFFDELGLPAPDHHLGVGSGTHGRQTALVLERVEDVLRQQTPDAVVVYGDTNSTLGGALAAAKLHIPVVHVEAGLRSFNKRMPEEVNRVLVDHLSSLLFCPSETAVENLRREGVTRGDTPDPPSPDHPVVLNTGDLMYDAHLHGLSIAERTSTILRDLGVSPGRYVLLTIHRAENTDDPEQLSRLVTFLNAQTAGADVIFPMHPRTRAAYERCPTRFAASVHLVDPVGHFDLLALLRDATRLFTDSGGLQREAYWLRVPCVTLRDETEWPETVSSGWNTLYRGPASGPVSPAAPLAYGSGRAAALMAGALGRAFAVAVETRR